MLYLLLNVLYIMHYYKIRHFIFKYITKSKLSLVKHTLIEADFHFIYLYIFKFYSLHIPHN